MDERCPTKTPAVAAKTAVTSDEQQRQQQRKDAVVCLGTGAAIGALGAITAVVGSAVCPVCIIAPPLLIGAGVIQSWRARRRPRP